MITGVLIAEGASARADAPTTKRYRVSDGQTIIGHASLIIGSVALGAVLLGYLQGSEIVPMFAVGSCGLVFASLWCTITKQYPIATVYGAFAGFNFSYALLQLGVSHDWYAIPIDSLTTVLLVYALSWLGIFLLLSFIAYQASLTSLGLFLSVSAGLGLVAGATGAGSLTLLRWAAVPVGLVALLSVSAIGHVMWGWHVRNHIARQRARGAVVGGPAHLAADRRLRSRTPAE